MALALCNPFDFGGDGCVSQIGQAAADSILSSIASAMTPGVDWALDALMSWLLVPAVDLSDTPAETLRRWMVPVTLCFAIGALMWQGIQMAMTRKGEPLAQALRGVFALGVWGAVAIVGTNLALRASDQYSCWVLTKGLTSGAAGADATPTLADVDRTCSAWTVFSAEFQSEAIDRLQLVLLPAAIGAPALMIILALIVIIVALIQAILMVFREGAVVILAALLQLAAAGTITRGTSPG